MFRTWFVILSLGFLIGSVLSLKCLKENPDLAEYNKPDPNKDKPDCVATAKSCVSAITTVKGKAASITKGCTTYNGPMGCTSSGVGEYKADTCYCNTDLCNTQQPGSSSASSINAVNAYISISFLLIAGAVL